jgi:hypothetical protein
MTKPFKIRNRESGIANADQSVRLNIFKDICDERGRACRSFAMKDEYENCYTREDAPNFHGLGKV